MTDRLTNWDAQPNEHLAASFGTSPLFPVAHTDASANPTVQLSEALQLVCQAEVAHPPTKVASQTP